MNKSLHPALQPGEGITEALERQATRIAQLEHELRNSLAGEMVKSREAQDARLALDALVKARALSGVRELVAGWNGEDRPDGPYQRHPEKLGATLPKTNCGAIYALDEAMQQARKIMSRMRTNERA